MFKTHAPHSIFVNLLLGKKDGILWTSTVLYIFPALKNEGAEGFPFVCRPFKCL